MDDWYLKLELILFNEAGQAIYVSETDDATYGSGTRRFCLLKHPRSALSASRRRSLWL